MSSDRNPLAFKRLFVHLPEGLARLNQGPIRDKPPMTEAADCGDSLVVSVVMDQGNVSFNSRSGEQQIGWRDSTMVTATGQGKLRLPRVRPEAGRHRDRLKSRETISDLLGTILVGGQSSQLEDD